MRTQRIIRRRLQPRKGIILIVVLGLLALLEIVGLTFEMAADTAPRALSEFRQEALELTRQSVRLSKIVGPQLRRANREATDFSDSIAALDEFATNVESFHDRVEAARAAETDPRVVEMLTELGSTIEDLQSKIDCLRRLIEKLDRSRSS